MLKWMLTALVFLACQLSSSASAAEAAQVSHTLSFPQKNNQYVHVNTKFEVESDQVELSLPSWNPGSYLIRDFAANLERFEATTLEGRSLSVTKMAKNRWWIDTRGVTELSLDYDVWAGQANVAESWIESDFALLNGAGIYLYNEQTRDWPQSVRIDLPDAWSAIHTSLKRSEGGLLYEAGDYDELVDSPIVAGNTVEHEFEVGGQPYSLVLSRENPLWDGEASAEDLARIVEAQQEFWGANPFDRKYLFLNLFMDKFGGLEHDHSTVLMCSPWQMRGREDYVKWLGLVSHEFFHSWNVRRMRPEALVNYDYDQEVYTRELWLAEGLTSYYDNLLLFRGGLIDVGDYFDLLAEEFLNYEMTPGREIRSAELSSFDTWIKQYKPDNNKFNSTVSYYQKGALIAFVTDMEIRRETNNRVSLDTVMREMYSRYGQGGTGKGGYPPGAFEDIVESKAGPKVRQTIEALLETTDDPDIDEALGWFGLVLERAPGIDNGGQAPAGFGVRWEITGAAIVAEHVLLGRPGAAAGILPGDELLAINGLRVKPENFQARLQQLHRNEQIELTLVRHGRLIELQMLTGAQIPVNYSIETKPGISNREKKRMEAWLGRDLKFLK
jgi:predicted metalloprotease with PDZ domain